MVGSSMVTDILLEPYLMEFNLTMVGASVFCLRSKVLELSFPRLAQRVHILVAKAPPKNGTASLDLLALICLSL
jgi:hypothetical protein